ncbi:hypothetical protein [Burkholderia sp. AU6039]|uniref:hypothetical protein n=1 Tax=Burkholderia sp. AU6039 TaxID=2015344 RepID=UPI00117EDF8C|nr:hypothetical protein [Burkholderia sp. AU6039]
MDYKTLDKIVLAVVLVPLAAVALGIFMKGNSAGASSAGAAVPEQLATSAQMSEADVVREIQRTSPLEWHYGYIAPGTVEVVSSFAGHDGARCGTVGYRADWGNLGDGYHLSRFIARDGHVSYEVRLGDLAESWSQYCR